MLRWSLAAIAALVGLALLFLIASWIGSSIPRNSDWEEPRNGIEIMVETNGVHTGIVMPVVNDVKDWRTTFPSAALPTPGGELPTHLAIGWGEKEVFLNTPTWDDLRLSTVLRVVFRGGDGLMRVGHYVRPAPSETHRPMLLRPSEYARLVREVEATLPPIAPGENRRTYDSYEPGARNYDALGRYTMFNTSNQWVSDTLAAAGMRIGSWTPFAGGVMKWIPRPRERQAVSLSAASPSALSRSSASEASSAANASS